MPFLILVLNMASEVVQDYYEHKTTQVAQLEDRKQKKRTVSFFLCVHAVWNLLISGHGYSCVGKSFVWHIMNKCLKDFATLHSWYVLSSVSSECVRKTDFWSIQHSNLNIIIRGYYWKWLSIVFNSSLMSFHVLLDFCNKFWEFYQLASLKWLRWNIHNA